MQLFLLFLLLSFVIFLFSLYKLAKDDIVFIRKNVSLEQLFNIAFILALIGLFSSRLVYVLANPAKGFLNPLVFLLFPYFPGLSLVGGVFGAGCALFYLGRYKRLPLGRVFDFFAISLFAALPLGLIGGIFLGDGATLLESFFLSILYIILLIVVIKVFFTKLQQNTIQQGSIASLAIMLFSLTSFLTSMVVGREGILGFVDVPEILAIVMFFTGLFFLIRQEG